MSIAAKFRRWTLRCLGALLVLLLLASAFAGYLWWYYHPTFERTNGIVYGQRGERELTLDVIRPEHPNGLGVALMVSGGWKSKAPGEMDVWIMAPLLRRGYTIFAICHVSQPESTIQDIIQDMHRGIRFVRYHARDYGIDPAKIGVTGGSAGGHLSLMLATRGGPGDPDASDPIDRESSAVQAVAIFYPVTDLLNLGPSTENPGDGGPPKSFVAGFGPEATDPDRWPTIGRECSPIYFINRSLPPTLIYHGDADTLVPLEQSKRFREAAGYEGAEVQLVVHRGGQHGWPSMFWDIGYFGQWFDRHLR